MKFLVCCEKYCDGHIQGGLSNSQHNILGTLKESNIDFNVIHYDECFQSYGKHINDILLKVVDKVKPDVVLVNLLLNSSLNPSIQILNQIKNRGIKICFLWHDLQQTFGINELKQYDEVANLHVSLASEENVSNIKNKILWLWTPESEKLYYPSDNKTIDVSFIGSLRYRDRQEYISYLLKNNVNIHISGGQREQGLSPEQYANAIRNSKISINFSSSPGGSFQVKGRVFETLACKSMLLEMKNERISKFLTPGKEYVEFSNPDDLKNKINYYLSHESERKQIAEMGYKAFQERFTAKEFWKRILQEI